MVVLEPLEARHEDGLWVASQHSEMWIWTIPRGKSPEHFQMWFQTTLEACEAGDECVLATVDRASGWSIGTMMTSTDEPHIGGLFFEN